MLSPWPLDSFVEVQRSDGRLLDGGGGGDKLWFSSAANQQYSPPVPLRSGDALQQLLQV
jgi:hypothetical protein